MDLPGLKQLPPLEGYRLTLMNKVSELPDDKSTRAVR